MTSKIEQAISTHIAELAARYKSECIPEPLTFSISCALSSYDKDKYVVKHTVTLGYSMEQFTSPSIEYSYEEVIRRYRASRMEDPSPIIPPSHQLSSPP